MATAPPTSDVGDGTSPRRIQAISTAAGGISDSSVTARVAGRRANATAMHA
jgi:hypothetical protein